MKSAIFFSLFFIVIVPFTTSGQGNHKPKIVGQEPLSVDEDQGLAIPMTALRVEDRDDWFYSWGFTMTLYPGEHYTVDGHVITPVTNFNGKLKVDVTVNDGVDESNKFKLEITVNPVNDKPVIAGHSTLSTREDQRITIQLTHLQVIDPDDKYPGDFSLTVHPGNNYSVEGNDVVPQSGFTGTLSVMITVNDGEANSDPYMLPVTVNAINHIPQITGQALLQIDEDATVDIRLTDLNVIDEDNHYPEGFTLLIDPGEDYTVSHTTITPAPNYYGTLSIPVRVSDGSNTSAPFLLRIAVAPLNDIPLLTELETVPLFFTPAMGTVSISETLEVADVDGDSIMFGVIGFRPGSYEPSADRLTYATTSGANIRGVFDPGTGMLTLIGKASPQTYTEAMRAVQYERLVPGTQEKVLYMSVNDGQSDSEEVERILRFGRASVSLDIPTGFTPNGDTTNDTWRIVPLKSEEQYVNARIKVYNKAGVLVYESIGLDSEWDGRLNGEPLPADTYFYTIDLNMNSPEGYLKGLVTILR